MVLALDNVVRGAWERVTDYNRGRLLLNLAEIPMEDRFARDYFSDESADLHDELSEYLTDEDYDAIFQATEDAFTVLRDNEG